MSHLLHKVPHQTCCRCTVKEHHHGRDPVSSHDHPIQDFGPSAIRFVVKCRMNFRSCNLRRQTGRRVNACIRIGNSLLIQEFVVQAVWGDTMPDGS